MKTVHPIPNLRWWIAALLALATGLSYLDRQTLPVVATALHADIPLTNQEFSRLQFMFLLSYGIMYIGGGRIVDWVGTRLGYTIFIVWWSAATLFHGFANSVMGLAAGRLMLGFGEGGGFPASAKAVSEWFPARDRGLAFGIFNTGSSLGAIIAPPLLALLITNLSWRWAFFITGSLGLIWAALWYWLYDQPRRHARITPKEREYLAAELPAPSAGPRVPWLRLLAMRQVWGLLAAKFLSDSAWYFFLFWLPKYLADVRGLNVKEIGAFGWIPYVFMGVGSFTGGWLGSHLIRRGFSIDASRKIGLAISASLMPASLLIASSPLQFAIVLFSVAMLGHQFWATVLQTLPADMFPSSIVGSVAGLMGGVGSFGGMLFNLLIGAMLAGDGNYAPVFVIAGLLHPLSFVVVLSVIRRINPVLPASSAAAR
ncbi:MAG: MFS transporter [Bryobacteraceae bacterium]